MTVNVILSLIPITDEILFSTDLNLDGQVDVLDVVLMINIILYD